MSVESEISRGLFSKLWAFLILLFLGCGYVYQGVWWEPVQEGTLTGRVTLEAGRGLEDVDVALFQVDDRGYLIRNREGHPNQRGWFRFEDLSPGDYYLEIAKPRYDPYFEQFNLDKDEGMYLEVELRRYSIPEGVEEVLVVGDFVDWDPQRALPMIDDDGDGLWETTTPLSAGRYSYKYVINGLEEWFIDISSGEYEPDGFGYYNSVVELSEAGLASFILDTNDPWFRRVAFQSPVTPAEVGRVAWEPEEPRGGQWITIFYDPRGGPLEDAQQILLHWGVNDWTMPRMVTPGTSEYTDGRAVQTPMEPDPDGTWWVVIPTDSKVWSMDFAFTDGQRWDDNQTEDWHVPVR